MIHLLALLAASVVSVQIDAAPAHRIQAFRPLDAIGSTVDKEPAGSIPALYSQANVREMLAPGYGWLSYRLFTELSDQDWHWNPAGSFSAGNAGYWTSSATPGKIVTDSFGYRLPHRGSTTDQGNNADYSRLDDGDPSTYWKSNPYLTSAFTGDADSAHPQWVVIDLNSKRAVDAMRIAWANPYATAYRVDYWTGADAIGDPAHGTWAKFPLGDVRAGHGGSVTLRLSATPVVARFLRVRMTSSSNTCDSHGSGDRRNCVGYAIGEISAGMIHNGRFVDYVAHSACGGYLPGKYACGVRQTAMYVSSADPWHSAAGRVRDQEQPGLDLIARSGLTRGLGGTYPVAMIYSTPENAVAEVRYLRARGYPIARIELGEEPDGQYIEPEDDAALYVQWAHALHKQFPGLPLGGPVFSGVNSDLQWWPDARGDVSWLRRFLNYLRAHDALSRLSFMSFEHYPFDGCEHGAALLKDLETEPSIVKTIASAWRGDGLPPSVPMYVTEANFSAVNFTQTPMQIEGALWLADYMAGFLEQGVRGIVYYQYEPVPLSQNKQCPKDWGNLTMFVAGENAHIRARGAQFYGGEMIAKQWLDPRNGIHELYPSKTNNPLVTAYTVRRPGNRWSVMVVNKCACTMPVSLSFRGAPGGQSFTGRVTRVTFGSAQYQWHAQGAASAPSPDNPPVTSTISASSTYTIPPQSITVLRGSLER
ncbi:MAG TPA: discoidin domain-containing protein [Candidatus Baltobacteraceae bacterium]|nr:discoidin domain-containing protein [Candidatus Baltobacteraceae bacterium]